MNKAQVITFWKALQASTGVKEVLTRYRSKTGYGGERTLERYAQAAKGFNRGSPLEEVAKKTGWGTAYVEKIHGWWRDAFAAQGPSAGAGAAHIAQGIDVGIAVEGGYVQIEPAQVGGVVCSAIVDLAVTNKGAATTAVRRLWCREDPNGAPWKCTRVNPPVSETNPIGLQPGESVHLECTFVGGSKVLPPGAKELSIAVVVEASHGLVFTANAVLPVLNA